MRPVADDIPAVQPDYFKLLFEQPFNALARFDQEAAQSSLPPSAMPSEGKACSVPKLESLD